MLIPVLVYSFVLLSFRSNDKSEKNNNLMDETDGGEILSSKHFMELKNDIEEKESTIKTLQKKYMNFIYYHAIHYEFIHYSLIYIAFLNLMFEIRLPKTVNLISEVNLSSFYLGKLKIFCFRISSD